MQEKFSVSAALYAGNSAIPFLVQSGARISTVGVEGNVNEGLCDSHQSGRVQAARRHHAKLSTAALFLDAVFEGEISCAVSSRSEVYGEIKAAGSNLRFIYDGTQIKCAGTLLQDKYRVVPVALYAIYNNDEVMKYFKQAAGSRDLESALAFCDSLWYDYAKNCPKIIMSDNLAIETIKTAYYTGTLTDKSSDLGSMPCSLFQDSGQRRQNGPSIITDNSPFSEFIHGRHLIAHQWYSCQEDRIRPLSYLEEYVPIPNFYTIMRKIDMRIAQNMVDNHNLGITDLYLLQRDMVEILLYGDPGTGKTILANAVSAATGMPIYEVITNEDSEDDVYEGKNKIIKGQLGFVETAFLEAFTLGGIILLEEVNLSRPNIATSVLNQVMEYPYILNRNGYERVTRNPFTIIIGTMNPNTDGTMPLNASTAQRFVHKYEIFDPTETEFKKILKSRAPKDNDVNYVYDAYIKIRNHLKESEQKRRYLKELSIRQCFGALASMEEGADPKEAICDTMYSALAIANKKLADTVKTTIIDNLPNYQNCA